MVLQNFTHHKWHKMFSLTEKKKKRKRNIRNMYLDRYNYQFLVNVSFYVNLRDRYQASLVMHNLLQFFPLSHTLYLYQLSALCRAMWNKFFLSSSHWITLISFWVFYYINFSFSLSPTIRYKCQKCYAHFRIFIHNFPMNSFPLPFFSFHIS